MSGKPSTCECGAPVALWCHECRKPLCWEHLSGWFLTPHCRECAAKHRAGMRIKAPGEKRA